MNEPGQNKNYNKNKPLELLKIKSSKLLLLDQFMLANKKFTDALEGLKGDRKTYQKLCHDWGGAIVDLENGDYVVDRFPGEPLILVTKHSKAEKPDTEESSPEESSRNSSIPDFGKESLTSKGRVFVDTRCLIVSDAEILENTEVLTEYSQQRKHEGEKAARDYLRSHGAAVRYGFNRYGDELGVFCSSDNTSLALWPDVVEN